MINYNFFKFSGNSLITIPHSSGNTKYTNNASITIEMMFIIKSFFESLVLLADTYKFKGPIVQYNSKTEFIAAAKELGKILTGVQILKIAENGNTVGIMYNFKSDIPHLENNIGSEWFLTENGLIQESELVFDATEWRKIFAANKL